MRRIHIASGVEPEKLFFVKYSSNHFADLQPAERRPAQEYCAFLSSLRRLLNVRLLVEKRGFNGRANCHLTLLWGSSHSALEAFLCLHAVPLQSGDTGPWKNSLDYRRN